MKLVLKVGEGGVNKNDVDLFLLEEPILPMDDMHIIWQRYFLFDIYDANKISQTKH